MWYTYASRGAASVAGRSAGATIGAAVLVFHVEHLAGSPGYSRRNRHLVAANENGVPRGTVDLARC